MKLAPGAPVPSDGKTYVGATRSGARISCLPTLKNGSGEGFMATMPDGTRYWFDWMVTKRRPSIMSGGDTGLSSMSNLVPSRDATSPQTVVPLVRAFLMVTRVEDRFGNFVTYSYDEANPHRLTTVTSNDGVSATVSYNGDGLVSTIASNGRTWTYTYTSHRLDSITLPDGSAWKLETQGLTHLFVDQETDVLRRLSTPTLAKVQEIR